MIENVMIDKVGLITKLYENKDRSGGAITIDKDHALINKVLILTYETNDIAQRVIDFGEVVIGDKG
jgi:hypothetical protein